MRRGPAALPVVALILALAASGCGGGNEGAAETAPPLTKHQLAHKLGEICQEHTDRQVVAIEDFDKAHNLPYGPAHAKASDAQLEKELVVVILPIVESTIHEVGKLRPPSSEQAEFKAFVKALENGVKASKEDPSWVATGSTEPFSKARATSAALGTYLCGQA